MRLAAALLLLATVPAQAAGLTIRTGETWFFTVEDGEPANARLVTASAKIPKGQIKASVRALGGTSMVVTNNSPIAYTFRAELLSGGKATAEYTLVPDVKVGDIQFDWLPVAFADVAPFKRFGLTRKPALLLGMDALKSFHRVEIDFANRQVRFRMRNPGEAPPAI